MLIVITQSTRVDWKGWTAIICERCDRLRAARVGHLLEGYETKGLRFLETAAGRVATCDFCGSGHPIDAEQPEIPRWSHVEGLAALANRVDPEFKWAPEPEGETQLRALLESGLEQKGAFTVNSGPGMVIGFFVGPALLLPIALVSHASGATQGLTALAGIVLGAFAGGLLWGLARSRANMRTFFAVAVKNYRLNPAQLTALSLQHAHLQKLRPFIPG